ncbi:ABC transporter permease [Bradyrhizobium sp. 4]|uniref:ABC transporter permease n=1 Tax=unclassified Bradyrhizobium TaxID=2631580 RepID=UPI001FF90C68|nr:MULTISPECIES: ABC transporter permease [unclassified Bradyrhizobium]MCK1396990.1 ABC transporter permease [Bradyrhizobium sp. 39]MCK1520117.1 ABC transporter permease [Bradyrhizobium sp. 17]MCK1632624.1 ABC transporter permease [Bradyrhizobium sp. 162]MCK1752266.1 ABC transporter permease [Bradyrhizobium sp. 135]UPJ36365.1 ABC transporter permease [Bradyrhizobium sp. 4]
MTSIASQQAFIKAPRQTFTKGRIVVGLATILYIYLLFPSLIIVPISFGNRVELVFPPTYYSLDLYRAYFGSTAWLTVTYRSATYALLASALAMAVGVPGAYALARANFPGKRLLVLLILSPMLVPIVVISLGLYMYYLRISLTGTVTGLVLAHAMYVTPFVILTISAGIENLDERLEKVAIIMGATQWRVFRQVVLPQLVPSLISAGLFAFLMSFDEVVIAWFVTGPSTLTLPVKMYSSIKWEIEPVLAAIATILTVLAIVICLATAVVTRGRARAR